MRDEIIKEFGDTTSVDYIGMTEGIMQITKYAEVVLGFLVVLIFSLMTFVVALELIYINLPVFRSKADQFINSDRRVAGLMLHDAVLAVQEANTIQTGVSPNKVYLGMKIKHIVVAVVLLNIILLGWRPIIGIVVSIASRVIEAFGSVI